MLAGVAAWLIVVPRKPLPLAALLLGTGFGFLVGCPGVLLNTPAFVRDVSYEARHVATGHGEVFADTLPAFVFHIVSSLRWGMTLPLLVTCLVAVGVAVGHRRPGDLLLAAFAVPYYLLIGLAAVKFARYTLPLFPVLCLLAGAAWGEWRNVRAQTAYRLFAGFAGIGALGFSIALDYTMTKPDARDMATAYIRSLPNVQSVGFAAGPWFYSPSLNPYFAHPSPGFAQQVTKGDTTVPRLIVSEAVITDTTNGGEKLLPVEWYTPLLTGTDAPDVLTFGEMHYDDWLRTRYKPASDYLNAAEKRYPVRRNFTNPITLFGVPVVRVYAEPGEPWHSLPTQTLPHDMLYTNPSVGVWSR